MIKRCVPLLFLLLLPGCFQVDDRLTVAADGSGAVHMEVKSGLPAQLASQMSMAEAFGGKTVMYPPLSEDEAHKFFPAKDFTVVTKEKRDGDATTLIIDAAFKDVNALLACPYGKTHQLTLTLTNNVLKLRAVSGLEGIARMAEAKDSGSSEMEMMAVPGLAEARKKTNEMRFEFHVTLPNSIDASNGHHETNASSWLAERIKSKDADDFDAQLGLVMEASCAGAGCTMTPVTPPRLALGSFDELQDQSIAATGAAPDTNKIAAAVRFVPYSLRVNRVMDLTGANTVNGQNVATLTGALIIPTDLAPQKWGAPELLEVTDAKGNSLKLPGTRESQMEMQEGAAGMMAGGDDDSAPQKEERHTVRLVFQPPDWKGKEIATIKASVALQYYGGSQLVKISKAIPAKWIMEMNGAMSMEGASGEKTISSPKLPELGVSLQLVMGMEQSGMTMLSLQITGSKSSLMETQVFDADGRPWPTMTQEGEALGMSGMCQVMVFGRPKPPLSLALLFSGSGAEVKAPILLEHVPTRGE